MTFFTSIALIVCSGSYLSNPERYLKNSSILEKNKPVSITGIVVGLLGFIVGILLYIPKIRLRYGLSTRTALIALSIITLVCFSFLAYLSSLLIIQPDENIVDKNDKIIFALLTGMALLFDIACIYSIRKQQ